MRKRREHPFVAKETKYISEIDVDLGDKDGVFTTLKLTAPIVIVAGNPYFLSICEKKAGKRETLYTIRELTTKEKMELAHHLKMKGQV